MSIILIEVFSLKLMNKIMLLYYFINISNTNRFEDLKNEFMKRRSAIKVQSDINFRVRNPN